MFSQALYGRARRFIRNRIAIDPSHLRRQRQSQGPHARVRRMGHPVGQRQRRRKGDFRFEMPLLISCAFAAPMKRGKCQIPLRGGK
jgi:hypothetical protein